MKAGAKQIALVSLALLLVFVLFRYAKTYSLNNKPEGMTPSEHTNAKGVMSDDEALSFTFKAMPSATGDSLRSLMEATKKSGDYKTLGNMAFKAGDPILGSWSYEQLALKTAASEDWSTTGDYYITTYQVVKDTNLRAYSIQKAIRCYESAIGKDSTITKNYVKLATCFTDGTGEVMKGVLLLRGVEKKDSLNSDLNLMLGRLAIMSGQFDKAVRRLEKLTHREPLNAEAWYQLAEAYKGKGEQEKALTAFNKFKSLSKNKDN